MRDVAARKTFGNTATKAGFETAPTTHTSSIPSSSEASGHTFIPPPYWGAFATATIMALSIRSSPSTRTVNLAGWKRTRVRNTATTYLVAPCSRVSVLAYAFTSESNPAPPTQT